MLRQSLSILKQLGSGARTQDATELLHADLVMVEQRVEPTKKAAQMLHKKLQGCMQSQAGLDAEKRMKKLPLMQLSVSMAESLKDLDAASSIRRVLEMCCFIQKMLASMLADFEMKVEKDVLEPLNKLSEDDLPEILKNKKQFAKFNADWNSAKVKSLASTGPPAKQDGLREEVEEAWRKLDAIKDQYSADLYHFATKEDDYANYFICLLELQAEHHKKSHEFLDKSISELKENHTERGLPPGLSSQKVYGEFLLSHLSESNRDIAAPIQECIYMLLRTGMMEEGLFRLAAALSVVKRLKTCLDKGTVDRSEFSMEPHAVAGALKCYLRELPEPLMTFDLYNDWLQAAGIKDLTVKLEQFRILLKKLPPENYNNLRYLVQFLSLLSEQQAVNKMSPSNIAIVLGPNLLWPKAEGESVLFDMASASSVQVVMVIEPLIQHSSSLFPEAVSFEDPTLPEVQDATPPDPPAQPLISGSGELHRTASSSSIASSCSSYHPPLSKTNSTASQDSAGFSSVKSAPATRGGASSRASAPPEAALPTSQNTTPSSSSAPNAIPPPVSNACSSMTTQKPSQISRTTGSNPGQARSPTQKQSSDQLEPIIEPPASPRAVVTINLPSKPARCINKPNQANEPLVVLFSKPKVPVRPKLQVPPPSTAAAAANTETKATPPCPSQRTSLKKPPLKKPGLKAPSCPPPLPPPS